jgi:hypothetical protein
MKSVEELKNIPGIAVSLEKQITDILSEQKINALTISEIISKLTGEFRPEIFRNIMPVTTINSFDDFSNVFGFYALVFHVLEGLEKNNPKVRSKIIIQNFVPIKFYWYEE